MDTRLKLIVPSVLLLVLLSAGVEGDEPFAEGIPFQVNTYATDLQGVPAVAADGDGTFVVVWQSGKFLYTGYDLYGQRLARDGSLLGDEFRVNTYTTSDQQEAAVEYAPNGDFLVVWQSGRSTSPGPDGDGSGIQGRRFAADGSPLASEFQVNSYTTFHQSRPSLGTDSRGNFVVVWDSGRFAYSVDEDDRIRGQRLAADGSPIGGELLLDSSTLGYSIDPEVAVRGNGDFMVVWGGFAFRGIRGRLFDADGSAVGPETEISTVRSFSPDVAVDGDDFVVVWHDYPDFFGQSIRGQRFTTEGVRLGEEFQVNISTRLPFGSPVVSPLSSDDDDGFQVVWAYAQYSKLDTIAGRRFSEGGQDGGPELQLSILNPAPLRDALSVPAIAADTNGDALVVWQAGTATFSSPDTGDGDFSGVFGRFLDLQDTLRLQDGRFRVWVDWRDFQGQVGDGALARLATDSLRRSTRLESEDSALFWYFSPDNWELMVKVLDGCGISNAFWVFSAATTSVEYELRVTDTWTGEVRSYFNPLGTAAPAVADTAAFRTCERSPPLVPVCDPADTAVCLRGERFRVEVSWEDFEGNTGLGSVAEIDAGGDPDPPVTSAESGVFWFFSPDNWEMQVKVLDACAVNGRIWVFAGATTTVEYTLHVEDTWTGEAREYFNPLGNAADAVTDTSAFATCDAVTPMPP